MTMIMHQPVSALFERSRLVELSPGEPLFLTGHTVGHLFLVKAGRVHLRRHTSHGVMLVLQNGGPGAVLAEASAYSPCYHCDAVATEATTVAALPKVEFLAALRKSPALAEAWSSLLARSVQAARVRAEIRSLPKVAERLDAWLGEGYELPGKGRWQEVAAELGVTREALYRELSRRRAGECNA